MPGQVEDLYWPWGSPKIFSKGQHEHLSWRSICWNVDNWNPITLVLKRKWRQPSNPLIRSPAFVLGHKDLDPYREVSSHKPLVSRSHFSASQGGRVSSRVGLPPSKTTRSQSYVNLYRLSSAYFPFQLFKYWRLEKNCLDEFIIHFNKHKSSNLPDQTLTLTTSDRRFV